MKKSFIFKGGIIALCIPFLASCNTSKDLKSLQDEANYTLNLSSSNIEFKENDYSSSEEKIKAKTTNGNLLDFGYKYAKSTNEGLLELKEDTGRFYNVSPINGLVSINVDFESTNPYLLVSYSNKKNVDEQQISVVSNQKATIPFGYKYFSISAISSNVTIKNVTIKYNCTTEDIVSSIAIEDKNTRYVLNDTYIDKNQLTVTAKKASGKSETLNYDASGENGYKLVGKDQNNNSVDLTKPFNKTMEVSVYAQYKSVVSNTITINVLENEQQEIKVTSLSVSPSTITLNKNDTRKLTVTVLPTNATNKELKYEMLDSTVASFNTSTLEVRGLNKGTTSLVVTTKDGTNIKQNVSITVNEGEGYYIPESLTYSLKDTNLSMGYDSLTTTGEQSILIVPVQLSGAKAWTTTMLNRIETAFFGEASETNYWETVKSFYDKASYGKLSITGEVAPVFKSSYKTTDFTEDTDVDEKLFKEYYNQANASLLKKYDNDNNGLVDSTIFIYSNNYSQADGSQFWAWVFYLDNTPNITKPNIGTYMWASYSFMEDGISSSDQIDSHTYIHEFGHVLGIDDYYCYDTNGWDPVGELEMQSYNVGDQGAFSKLQCEWIMPYVIDGTSQTTEITLKTSALYPNAILINDNWNGSSEDEYILIEYYTPKGNNTKDSQTAYDGRSKMYTTNGLRIYHVDARLAKLNKSTEKFISYSSDIKDDGYIYFPGASNSVCYSYLSGNNASNFKLVQIMQANVTSATSRTHLKNGGSLSNSTLYGLNKTFKASSVFFTNGTKFNNGNTVGYEVTMISNSDEECVVRISKI